MLKIGKIMELIQIIIISLKLFVLLAAIIVLVSYFVFKVKDRKRRKPYSNSFKEEPIKESPLKNLPSNLNEVPIENKNSRFQVLNMPANFASDDIIVQKKDFKNQLFNNSINYKQYESNKSLDIYERYSNSDFEPMHKIKL